MTQFQYLWARANDVMMPDADRDEAHHLLNLFHTEIYEKRLASKLRLRGLTLLHEERTRPPMPRAA